MLIKLKIATKLGAQQCFARPGLRTRDIQIHGVMAILLFLHRMAEQGSHGLARISVLRPYPVGIMHLHRQ